MLRRDKNWLIAQFVSADFCNSDLLHLTSLKFSFSLDTSRMSYIWKTPTTLKQMNWSSHYQKRHMWEPTERCVNITVTNFNAVSCLHRLRLIRKLTVEVFVGPASCGLVKTTQIWPPPAIPLVRWRPPGVFKTWRGSRLHREARRTTGKRRRSTGNR